MIRKKSACWFICLTGIKYPTVDLIIILSGYWYVLAFINPFYFFWTSYTAFIPFFLWGRHITGRLGILWGFTFYSIFFIGILDGLYTVAPTARWLAYSIGVLYGSFLCGLFFAIIGLAYRNFPYAGFLIMGLWFVFVVQDYLFFIPLGTFYGNRLAHPAIPLMHYPHTLWYCIQVSGTGAIGLILLINYVASVCIKNKKYRVLCLLGITILFPLKIPSYNHKPLYGVVYWKEGYEKKSIWEKNLSLAEKAAALCFLYPTITHIFGPESSLKCSLDLQPQLVKIWEDYAGNCYVILGALRNACYNTAYCLHQGNIISFFDKKKLLFFTEYLPGLLEHYSHFFSSQDYFKRGSQPRVGLCNNNFLPYICSEFFLSHTLKTASSTIVVLVNDSWFRTTNVAHLMLLYARFQALTSGRSIVYCSYYYAYLIERTGKMNALPCQQAS